MIKSIRYFPKISTTFKLLSKKTITIKRQDKMKSSSKEVVDKKEMNFETKQILFTYKLTVEL